MPCVGQVRPLPPAAGSTHPTPCKLLGAECPVGPGEVEGALNPTHDTKTSMQYSRSAAPV